MADQSVKFRVGGCDLCGRNLTDVRQIHQLLIGPIDRLDALKKEFEKDDPVKQKPAASLRMGEKMKQIKAWRKTVYFCFSPESSS